MTSLTDERLAELLAEIEATDASDDPVDIGRKADACAALTELTHLRRQLREAKEALDFAIRVTANFVNGPHLMEPGSHERELAQLATLRALKELV